MFRVVPGLPSCHAAVAPIYKHFVIPTDGFSRSGGICGSTQRRTADEPQIPRLRFAPLGMTIREAKASRQAEILPRIVDPAPSV
jgi:hypothetical protein